MPNFKPINLSLAALLLTAVVASGAETLIDLACTCNPVTSKTGLAAIGQTTNDFWNTYTWDAGGVPDLDFTDGTPSGVGVGIGLNLGCYGNGASDPMYGTYFFEYGSIPINVSNLVVGAYNFYLYGHGNEDYDNTVFQLTVASQTYGSAATTNGAGWSSAVWQEGVQYVEFTNVSVSTGQAVNILAQNGDGSVTCLSGLQIETVSSSATRPFLVSQPADQTVIVGTTATLSVSARGPPPLAYQWLLYGSNAPGATNSSYSVIAQASTAGEYSIVVSNPYGSITNTVGLLNAVVPVFTPVIDVAFGGARVTGKTGFAATGVSATDFWNTFQWMAPGPDGTCCSGSLTDLGFTDGSGSGVGLEVSNDEGSYANGATDPMYGDFLFCYLYPIYLTITNLNFAVYDLYFYGHGQADDLDGVYQVSVGPQSYGTETTIYGPGWLASAWEKGVQYVEFSNVIVLPGQPINVLVPPGAGSYAILSGLQIVTVDPSTYGPIIGIQPTNQSTAQGFSAHAFQVVAIGAQPLEYQWLFNAAVIVGATNSSYTPANTQLTNAGSYSVVVSNIYGAVTSTVATLTVLAPSAPLIDVAFNGGPPTSKVGFAAIGITSNDFWNTWAPNSPPLNLARVDLVPSGVTLSVDDVSVIGQDNSPDAMYGTFVAAYEAPIGLFIGNLAPGTYNIFLYGHANPDDEYGIFHLFSGAEDYGTETTTTGSNWLSPTWQEGVQYVEFPNLTVNAGQTITIIAEPGASGWALLSGLQVAILGFGPQPLLGVSRSANSNLLLTLYGNVGSNYTLLSTTNLFDKNSWVPAGSITLTNLSQVIPLGPATNQMQFFRAVQP